LACIELKNTIIIKEEKVKLLQQKKSATNPPQNFELNFAPDTKLKIMFLIKID